MTTTMTTTTTTLGNIYGPSYFGSGGAYGKVYCCHNCRAIGRRDNGFVDGPDAVEVVDPRSPARYYARGGDCVGDGRDWGESGEWIPAEGRWVPSGGHGLPSRGQRRAWLHVAE